MENNQLFKKMKWNLFLLGKLKIPMLSYTGVKLIELNDNEAKVSIKLKRRTKNHLNSMYFGALAVGADVAGGIHAFYYAKKMNKKISFAFKGMNAQFIKGQVLEIDALEIQKKETSAPKPFTDGTLLNAMKYIGKQVDDETLAIHLKTRALVPKQHGQLLLKD